MNFVGVLLWIPYGEEELPKAEAMLTLHFFSVVPF